MKNSECVILVGDDLQTNLPGLVPALEARGFRLLQVPTVESLNAVLRSGSAASIVVYEPRGEGIARQVLRTVAEAQQRVPVVVVSSEGNFDEYYELMCEGAYDYFDVRDGPEVVERSVRWGLQAA